MASPTTLVANGSTQSTITVQAKDANGNNLVVSGGVVTLQPSLGTIGTVTDNADGTYSARFTSPTTTGTSTITGTIGGNPDHGIGHHWTHFVPYAAGGTRRLNELGKWDVQHLGRNGHGHQFRYHGERFRTRSTDRRAIWI